MRRLAATALGALALFAGGCGDDDEPEGKQLPANIVSGLNQQLDSLEGRIQNGSVGACDDILEPGQNADTIKAQLAQIPDDVDQDLRNATVESFRNLETLVRQQCEDLRDEEDDETDTTTDETVTEPPQTETETQTETVPQDTQTETTPPQTETETAPDEGTGGTETPDSGDGGAPFGGE